MAAQHLKDELGIRVRANGKGKSHAFNCTSHQWPPVSDGAGVDIRRVIGLAGADYVDPFLMFDDFRNDDPLGYMAGFPP